MVSCTFLRLFFLKHVKGYNGLICDQNGVLRVGFLGYFLRYSEAEILIGSYPQE